MQSGETKINIIDYIHRLYGIMIDKEKLKIAEKKYLDEFHALMRGNSDKRVRKIKIQKKKSILSIFKRK